IGPREVDVVGTGPSSSSELVAEATGSTARVVASASPSAASSSSSSKMEVPSSSSPATSKTEELHGAVSSKVTSQVSLTMLVSIISTRYALECEAYLRKIQSDERDSNLSRF